jgi:hypothetical protein
MKTFFPLLLLAALASAEWVDFGMDGLPSAEITVLEATPTGLLVELVLPGIEVEQMVREGKVYHELSIPGTTPFASEEGWPSIPSMSFLAAVSSEGISSITVQEASWVDLGIYTPSPMQPIPCDNSYDAIPFTVDQASYSGVHPSNQTSWVMDGVLRGVDVGRINICPVRWDAGTGVLSASSKMVVKVEFAGSVSMEQRLNSRFWNSTFHRTLVNADMLGSPRTVVRSSSSLPVKALTRREADEITAADFLIIAGDDFADTLMNTFITQKTKQGFLTAIVAAGSWTQTEIKAYVQNAYNTWTIPPSFVLFVGDSGDLTPYAYNGMSGDNRYCCVDGSDYMADIFNGRFVTGTDNYSGVESKVLKWEFDPLMNTAFWNNGLCAGMLQTYGGTVSARWFLFTCETVRDTYQNIYGKTFNREYVKDTTQPPPYYYHSHLPSAGLQVPSDIVWDGNAAGILGSINDGVFIIQHRDHGAVEGWGDPAFTISDFSGLANGEKTPMVMSINCLTGQFVNNCFAENLFARENGAVAVVAAVESSYSYFNDYFCYGMYKSFNDQYTSPPFSYTNPGGDYMGGQALINGKLEMQAAAPYHPYSGSWETYAEKEWDLFQWFGDPTMDMRTDLPHSLTVTVPGSLPSGSTTAVFTVTDSKGSVEGAMVCMMHPGDLWVSGVTNASGNVTLTFPAIGSLDNITYMATAHNALPSEGVINNVGIEEQTSAVLNAFVGNPYPNPASASITFPFTLDGAGSVAITVFDITGRTVNIVKSGDLESGSHSLVWDTTETPQGVYMARITNQNGTVTSCRFVISR